MKRFLRDNWLWITAPLLLALLVLAVVAIASHSDSFGDFVYFR